LTAIRLCSILASKCHIASYLLTATHEIISTQDCIGFSVGHSFELKTLLKEAQNARRSESESRHRHNANETEFWGYVTVRPGAHMFYWLYHSYHHDGYLKRPLIIWLQVKHDKNDENDNAPITTTTTTTLINDDDDGGDDDD